MRYSPSHRKLLNPCMLIYNEPKKSEWNSQAEGRYARMAEGGEVRGGERGGDGGRENKVEAAASGEGRYTLGQAKVS